MTQTVFLKALEKPDQFRGQSAVSTYLFSMATNLCLNRIRDNKARSKDWQKRVSDHIALSAPAVDPQRTTESRLQVEQVLQQTDAKTREIALYHYVDGFSQTEIAGLVGLSRVSVNQRLQKLKALSKNEDPQ